MIALEPCPFCCGEAELDTRRAYRNLSTGQIGDAVAIYCLGCSADMSACRADHSGLDDEDIIHMVTEMWNRRSTSAAVRGMREALSELLAADDAMTAFIIAAEPAVLGETEWAQQHRERSARRRKAIDKARAALSGIEPGEDEQARPSGSAPISTDTKDTTK